MIKLSSKGSFNKTYRFLKKNKNLDLSKILNKYGKIGVDALSKATPVDTGTTAASWDYEIDQNGSSITITWTNSNTNRGVSIAMLIQMGHGTRNGGFVEGYDFINPAMKPIFDDILNNAVEEVRNA